MGFLVHTEPEGCVPVEVRTARMAVRFLASSPYMIQDVSLTNRSGNRWKQSSVSGPWPFGQRRYWSGQRTACQRQGEGRGRGQAGGNTHTPRHGSQ